MAWPLCNSRASCRMLQCSVPTRITVSLATAASYRNCLSTSVHSCSLSLSSVGSRTCAAVVRERALKIIMWTLLIAQHKCNIGLIPQSEGFGVLSLTAFGLVYVVCRHFNDLE